MKTSTIKLPHQDLTFNSSRVFVAVIGSYLILSYMCDPAFAVTVDALKAPMKNLKSDIFGGWMFAAKLGACVVGAVMAVARSSLTPFGVGVGTLAGITLLDKYLGDDATGALI